MADDKTLSEDDDLEIVEVDKLPTTEEIAQRDAAAAGDKSGDDEGDEDDEDTRLVEREDDGADEKTKDKRKARRAAQRAARDRTLAQVDTLTRQLAEQNTRIAELQGHTVGITEREIASKLASAKTRLADFDAILAKAVETGDGEGTVTAMRMRDEVRDEARMLEATAGRIAEAKTAPAPQPKTDPRVSQLADQWRSANPWYDTKGGDEDSAIVNAIDNRLTAEGFNPSSMDYWQELTKRVAKRIGTNDVPASGASTTVRKGPAVGGDRSAGTPGARKEVYVTPERKQAMQEAGIWDDPVKRTKMLKSYRDYDAQAAR